MKAHAVAAMTTALHDLGAGLLRHQPIHSSHSTLHPRCNLMRTGGRRYQLAAGHHLLPHRLARECSAPHLCLRPVVRLEERISLRCRESVENIGVVYPWGLVGGFCTAGRLQVRVP